MNSANGSWERNHERIISANGRFVVPVSWPKAVDTNAWVRAAPTRATACTATLDHRIGRASGNRRPSHTMSGGIRAHVYQPLDSRTKARPTGIGRRLIDAKMTVSSF